MESHEPAVGLLGVVVELNRLRQHLDCHINVAGVLLVLGEPEMRVESAAVKVLPRRIRPGVIAVLQKISPV